MAQQQLNFSLNPASRAYRELNILEQTKVDKKKKHKKKRKHEDGEKKKHKDGGSKDTNKDKKKKKSHKDHKKKKKKKHKSKDDFESVLSQCSNESSPDSDEEIYRKRLKNCDRVDSIQYQVIEKNTGDRNQISNVFSAVEESDCDNDDYVQPQATKTNGKYQITILWPTVEEFIQQLRAEQCSEIRTQVRQMLGNNTVTETERTHDNVTDTHEEFKFLDLQDVYEIEPKDNNNERIILAPAYENLTDEESKIVKNVLAPAYEDLTDEGSNSEKENLEHAYGVSAEVKYENKVNLFTAKYEDLTDEDSNGKEESDNTNEKKNFWENGKIYVPGKMLSSLDIVLNSPRRHLSLFNQDHSQKPSTVIIENKIPENLEIKTKNKSNQSAGISKRKLPSMVMIYKALCEAEKYYESQPPGKVTDDLKPIEGAVSLWISGLERETRSYQLMALFSFCGKVYDVTFVEDSSYSPPARFAFVRVSCEEDAQSCISMSAHIKMGRRSLIVRKCTEEEEEAVKKCVEDAVRLETTETTQEESSSSNVFAVLNGVKLLHEDVSTLFGEKYLNDEVINFYLDMIVERSKQTSYPSVFAFSTSFYNKLKEGYSFVSHRTEKIDIFDKIDMILVPIKISLHRGLSVIDFRSKKIKLYDSSSHFKSCFNILSDYLVEECMAKRKEVLDKSCWSYENVKNIPKQRRRNHYDCGVFLLKYAECVSRDVERMTFTSENMPKYRMQIAYEIYRQKLL